MNRKDGGHAFPSGQSYKTRDLGGNSYENKKGPLHAGMSLRAWLAGQALAGRSEEEFRMDPDTIARRAVQIADATLAELER